MSIFYDKIEKDNFTEVVGVRLHVSSKKDESFFEIGKTVSANYETF